MEGLGEVDGSEDAGAVLEGSGVSGAVRED